MTYITSGDVVQKRSIWRVSIVSDVFWGIVNFIGLFTSSIFS
uniref:Selenoprotein K n=1 Tax=Globisporangium ultimum (strain ATCC 200006 / CBS 805.95 / DAOM BR144) TaxID=431595 RepID=K3X5C9_GLOUD